MQPSYDLASIARKVLSASRPKIQHIHPEESKKEIIQTMKTISDAFDDEFSPFEFKDSYMGSWMNDEDDLSDNFDFNLHKLNNIRAKVDYFLVNFKTMQSITRDELASNINSELTEKFQINICDDNDNISKNLYIYFNNMNIIFKLIVMGTIKFITSKYKIFKPAKDVNSQIYYSIMHKFQDNDKASKIYTAIKSFSADIKYNIDEQIFQIIKNKINNGIYLLNLFERNSEQALLNSIYEFTELNAQVFEHKIISGLNDN